MEDQPPLLVLPVYEPAGRDVFLMEKALLQHLIVIGATGSGKTCLLHRVMEQLLKHERTGLLIFDAKADDTVARVRELARQCGRSGEVVVLGPKGDHYLDLLRPLRSLADVDRMARRILAGSSHMGNDNVYWEEFRLALIDASLTLLAVGERPVRFGPAMSFLHEWFFTPKNVPVPRVRQSMECVTRFLEYASPAEKRKLSQTLDTVSLWQHLDDKTRGNVQSTLLNALRPLLSLSAAGCFEPQNRPLFDVAGVATRGAVCVASVNATTDPDLASLFFKLVKQDFFGAVQQRSTGAEPLCAVLVDELPLLVAKEDAEVLATVRSRRCSVVSATQSLSAIDERVGVRTRKALLGNFGTIIFMRGREEEVDTFAATHLGTRVQVETFRTTVDEGGLLSEARGKMRHRVWVCPPGTLGRLEPHQGFVALPGNSRQDHPLTFVPWFEEHRDPAFEDPASLPHLQSLLRRHGLREENDDLSVKVALLLCSDESQHDRVLEEATGFFRAKCALVPRGLETLPVAWLKALPKILWSLRQPHWTQLPFMISEVCGDGGLLRVRFAQETPCPPKQDRVTAWDWIRVKINSSLYPSRWRPLTPRHRHHIGARKLELSSPGASTIT